jgi:hypothetical protein
MRNSQGALLVEGCERKKIMSATKQNKGEVAVALLGQGNSEQTHVASFGTALLGFMITTTLTTSLMVLLSQG